LKVPDIDTLQQLISLVETNQLDELSVAEENCSVTIRCEVEAPPAPLADPAAGQTPSATPPPPPEPKRNLVHITSPIVGVFYRAPEPTADPYVSVGSLVDEGTVVGLVEAMKVFNEIYAGVRGRVVEIPAENEQLVSRGETLVLIDPAG